MVLIEPVCNEQLPGFYLRTIDQAGQVLTDINHPNLKIMFDCYHIFHESGELEANFAAYVKQIGHVQIAAAEDRAEPFLGVIDYKNLLLLINVLQNMLYLFLKLYVFDYENLHMLFWLLKIQDYE